MKKIILTLMAVTLIALPVWAANEFVISEYTGAGFANGQYFPVFGDTADIQYKSAGDLSDAFGANTYLVEICNNSASNLYYKFGDSSVSAAALTDGNHILFANTCRDHVAEPGGYVDSAQ